jgi:hypothetical protein
VPRVPESKTNLLTLFIGKSSLFKEKAAFTLQNQSADNLFGRSKILLQVSEDSKIHVRLLCCLSCENTL